MKSIIRVRSQAKQVAKEKKIKIKEALELLAKEAGYPNWKLYKDSLDTFWYSKASPFLNQWFNLYKEAKEFQQKNGGFLLTYKGQYFVVEKEYIEHLGLDPEDEIWGVIDQDVSQSVNLEKLARRFL